MAPRTNRPIAAQLTEPRDLADVSRRTMRRICADVLPRTERRIQHGLDTISESIGRELRTTQRLLDPDD